jgi:Protein of unknown function (DUF992)
MSKFSFSVLLCTALALVNGSPLSAHSAPVGAKVGVLTCDVSGGVDFIRSSHALSCSYQGTGSAPVEHYIGHISSVGANFGYTKDAKIVWAVVAPSSDFKAQTLEGEYAGVTAGATVGVGGAANVLVGGLDKSVSLQPLSFEGSEGINIAAGVTAIKLVAAD